MSNKATLKPFPPGVSGNPGGRPKGTQNRNTVARKILGKNCRIPDVEYRRWKQLWPDLEQLVTGEEMITYAAQYRAITQDSSYKVLMDSGYGAPKQEIDMTSEGERINPTINITNSIAPLSTSEKDVKLD